VRFSLPASTWPGGCWEGASKVDLRNPTGAVTALICVDDVVLKP
jgi:hypothetical protein